MKIRFQIIKKTLGSATLAGLILGSGAFSQAAELPKRAYLPLELAQQAANAALKKCSDDGYRVSATVVDDDGVIQVVLHGDGAGPHTINSSSGKAFTAASMGRATGGLADFMKDKPELDGLRDMDERILILGGGLPIKFGDELVGGIGVGGAPGSHLDEACAQAGIESIGADQ